MSNTPVSDLPVIVGLLSSAEVPAVQSGVTGRTTAGAIASLGSPAGLSAAFVVLSTDPLLTDARILTASSNVTLTDAGAGSTVTVDLSATGVTAATYGDASHVARVTVDAKGRITSASNVAISAAAASVVVGTTLVTGGTATRVLYDNAGTLGEYTISGSGSVAMTTNAVLTTPNLGTPSAVTLTNGTGLPIAGITGLGTGVGTALAVNVGSAGAVVVNGGALGTPSSGTLTNCTGYTVANVSGLGTGVATALAVNVGSAGAIVVNGGALGTPSSGTLTNTTGFPLANLSGAGTGILAALAINTGSAGAPVLFNGAGGTPSSLTLTNATGLPIAGTTGYGTGVATALAVNVGSAGAFVTFNGAGGTPSSLTLTNATGLPVAGGGTGAGTFTDGGVLIGNGTSAVQVTSAGTAGYGFVSGGSGVDPTWQNNASRAHISFNGTGTPAARGTPFNVTSITDNGTGDWTLNFTSALPSINYTVTGTAADDGTNFLSIGTKNATAPTTTALRLFCGRASTPTDSAVIGINCIGG